MEFDFIKNDKNVNTEDVHKIIEHLYKDYLLIKRLIYKVFYLFFYSVNQSIQKSKTIQIFRTAQEKYG